MKISFLPLALLAVALPLRAALADDKPAPDAKPAITDKPAADENPKDDDQSAKAQKQRATAAAKADVQVQIQAGVIVFGKGQLNVNGLIFNGPVPAQDPAKPDEVNENGLTLQQQAVFDRLQPILKAELAFAVRVCKLDGDQRKILADAGNESAKKIAKDLGATQQLPRGLVIRGNGKLIINGQVQLAGQAGAGHSARQMLQGALGESIQSEFSKGVAKNYTDELANRTQSSKQMVVDTLLVMLDKRLILTDEQRGDISKSLMEHFDETWSGSLPTLITNQQYLPNIPDACIVPHLRDSQRAVWQSLPNRNVQFGFDNFDTDPTVNLIQLPPLED
jgi:hypothetical protein